tara:strand:- start:55 stop:957 length:903 start_codon:yes stop_codon:yes gene_type:complete
MKQIAIIIVIFLHLNLFGQELSEEAGVFEVQLIRHYHEYGDILGMRKGKTNRKSRPYQKLYFNSKGTLLKAISFGKHHDADLRLIDNINVYNYKEEKLIESIKYVSDYEGNLYPYYKSIYTYNEKEQLVDESTFYYKTDSLFFKTTYEYDLNSNNVKTIFNPTYYQREFDSLNRIIVLRKVYKNELRWAFNYMYADNIRTGIFQTYYNDGKDYSIKETKKYNSKGLLVETEEVHLSKDGLDKKTKYFYDKNGMILSVEKYNSCSFEKTYRLVWSYKIRTKSNTKINYEIAERINKHINID